MIPINILYKGSYRMNKLIVVDKAPRLTSEIIPYLSAFHTNRNLWVSIIEGQGKPDKYGLVLPPHDVTEPKSNQLIFMAHKDFMKRALPNLLGSLIAELNLSKGDTVFFLEHEDLWDLSK